MPLTDLERECFAVVDRQNPGSGLVGIAEDIVWRLERERDDLRLKVKHFFEKADAMKPEDFKTGQDHLPLAFREVNFRDAFMALGNLVNDFQKECGWEEGKVE